MDKKLRAEREQQVKERLSKKNVKMFDAGEKMSEMDCCEEKPSKNKKYYPYLSFESDQFPEIKKMKIGKKYTLVIEVNPTRYSTNEREGKETESSISLEVLKVGLLK